MTQDQIKALAKEYAKWFMAHTANRIIKERNTPQVFVTDVDEIIASNAEGVCTWLNDRYCIVEREKVMKEYDTIKHSKERDYSYEDVLNLLVYLFGTSMFNQNEE